MNTSAQGFDNSRMSSEARTALIRIGAAGATATTVYGVKKVKQGQAMQTQEEAAMQEPMQEECSIDSTPQPAQIDAPLSTITGEELRQGDAKILFARWFDRQVAAKRMLVVNGAEIGSGEGDFLIGEGTRSGQDQLYVWELRGKDWTKIATVAQGNGKVELTDLDLEGTPFAIEVEGQLYRSGEVTVPGSAALAVVEA